MTIILLYYCIILSIDNTYLIYRLTIYCILCVSPILRIMYILKKEL